MLSQLVMQLLIRMIQIAMLVRMEVICRATQAKQKERNQMKHCWLLILCARERILAMQGVILFGSEFSLAPLSLSNFLAVFYFVFLLFVSAYDP